MHDKDYLWMQMAGGGEDAYLKEYTVYPNQQTAQQMPPVQKLLTHVEHWEVSRLQKFGESLVDTFGWGWIIGLAAAGALSVGGFLIRRKLRSALGDYAKEFSDWLNK